MRESVMVGMLCLAVGVICGGACSGKPGEVAPRRSDAWRSVAVDSIPQLMAVELPLDMHMVSERAREEGHARNRIPLSDGLVIAFETWSSIGLLRDSVARSNGISVARQFSAYCSSEGKAILVYNFVNVGYKGCAMYRQRWRGEIVGDTECTSLGVFQSTIPCG